ncbi:hypothetical protein [Acetobacterium wieringae]|uniref:hypothetical protein n=1 Tax=Acetobacterium wieringae TaxID=52694 RepID=UPI0020349F55|nr:hypothetical protein [Acetobacterium wieringae]URN85477.1 hypothetical protein CHL1_001136 [Acetobacterium wieringae]
MKIIINGYINKKKLGQNITERRLNMLHSEDADINVVIRQVINLDTKAVRIKKNVVQRAERILDRTKNDIKEKEKAELDGAQELAKQNYQQEINKAREERQKIIDGMEEELTKIRCRYDEKKKIRPGKFWKYSSRKKLVMFKRKKISVRLFFSDFLS